MNRIIQFFLIWTRNWQNDPFFAKATQFMLNCVGKKHSTVRLGNSEYDEFELKFLHIGTKMFVLENA